MTRLPIRAGSCSACELAERFAKRFAKRFRRADWRELVTDCWTGIARAQSAGATDAPLLYRAALGDVLDAHRTEFKTNRKFRLRAHQFPPPGRPDARFPALPHEGALVGGCERAGAVCPLLATWCEYRPQRLAAGIDMRDRVLAYLHLVEGVPQKELAELWGVYFTAVSKRIIAFKGAVRAAVESRSAADPEATTC